MHRGLLLGAILMVTAIWWFANPPVAALSDRGNAAFDSGFATPAPVTGTLSQPVDRELAAPVPNDAERGVASRFAAESDTTNHRPRAVTPEPPSPDLRRLRVLDPLGRPIIGAELSVGMVFDSDGRRRGDGPVAITDAFGRARMMLAAGTYVQACAAGFVLSGEKIEAGNEEVEIVLTGALRLEIAVVGPTEFTGLHARVSLPSARPKASFYQSKYAWTPGRAVDGAVARWAREPNQDGQVSHRSHWDVCLTASGTATLDQIEDVGEVTVQLRRFRSVLAERKFEIPHDGKPVSLQFALAPQPPLRGVVVNSRGRPLQGALLRMAPFGATIIVDSGTGRGYAFPVWAPSCEADGDGQFILPRPDDERERIVITCKGYAARALTVAEVEASDGRIALQAARTVRLEVIDCNGRPLDGGHTTGGHYYAEPSVLLGHDVWRGTGDGTLPWFVFEELPPNEVTFRCAGEFLRHDARIAQARLQTVAPVESMGIGK
mgnify:CR=1 FL=1